VLIIAILVLLLASTPSHARNSYYQLDYIKLNRIALIIFILSSYIAYNVLYVEAFNYGIGIYGGVFKITVLSQSFDVFLFLIGALVSILTCFVPYPIKIYNYSESLDYIMDDEKDNNFINFINNFNFYPYFIINKRFKKIRTFINKFSFIKWLANLSIRTPYLLENKLDYKKLEVKEYSLLLLYTVLGGSLLISSNNLISLYLSLELQSFTLYILSASQIKSFKGTSGGLKYFLLGGLSSGFILLGCSLLYAYTGTLNLEYIFMIYSDNLSNVVIDPCLLILFSGLLFKISAAPFHNWAPDVYNDVPTYSTTWLIIIAKVSIFILMLVLINNIYIRLNINSLSIMEQNYSMTQSLGNKLNISSFSVWNPSYNSLGLWTNIIILSAIFSLFIGTVLGLSQSRIKRLFAYSTITHVGFLLLALSLNSVIGVDAFLFYLIQYTITNLNLFFILIAWGYHYCRYYLDSYFMPVHFININHYSWKNMEPTWYDSLESMYDKYLLSSLSNYNTENYHVSYNNLDKDKDIYDFNDENSEWLYTPVPYLTHFKGMHKTDPFLAFCLSICIFSLMGIPPLIGFFAKQQVLLASMQLDYYVISLIAILTSVIGAAYYLRIIKFIYFYDDVFMPYYLSQNLNKNNIDTDLNKLNIKKPSLNLIKSEFKLVLGTDSPASDNKDNLSMLPSNSLSYIIAILTNVSLLYLLKPYIFLNGINIITITLFQY
jgi:NADH-ubiquinone oxidoreductase chain 2